MWVNKAKYWKIWMNKAKSGPKWNIGVDKPKQGHIMTLPNFTLVNFSCELGQMMNRYDFLEAR